MAFPETRQTLIQRLANSGSSEDWRQFLEDYWGPVCRFASRRGALTSADAEDVASLTFEALLSNQLLVRWVQNRSAKLRTLLCSVVRNVISNRARVHQGRERIVRELSEQGGWGLSFAEGDESQEEVDVFYAAWVADTLEQVVRSVFEQYHKAGKGDYFRTLYGRICDEMTMPEIAALLEIPLTAAENYYKAARKRIADQLDASLREHVSRYSTPDTLESEWEAEWHRLGEYLKTHGGLEQVIRQVAQEESANRFQRRKSALISATLLRSQSARSAE